MPEPKLWASQVKDEYKGKDVVPPFIQNLRSSSRTILGNPQTFSNPRHYDAYSTDIAVLQVFFDKPVVFLFESSQRLTWIGFFSNIGGLLGLCIGMSMVTIIEVFWIAFCIGFAFLKPKR